MSAGEGQVIDVFVAHAAVDRVAANAFAEALNARGLTSWVPPRDDDARPSQVAQLTGTDSHKTALVVVLSKDTSSVTNVHAAVARAGAMGLPVYWVSLDGTAAEAISIPVPENSEFIDATGGDGSADWAGPAAQIAAARALSDPAPNLLLHGWPGRLARVVFLTIVGWGLLSIDPLGLDGAADRESERIIYNVLSPFYGEEVFNVRGGVASGIDWQDHITVMLLDDSYLKRAELTWPDMLKFRARGIEDHYETYDPSVMLLDDSDLGIAGRTWPVSLEVHARVIEDLYETYHPSVIMLDILFLDRRRHDERGLGELVRVLKRIRNEAEGCAPEGENCAVPGGMPTKVFLGSNSVNPEDSVILPELAELAELVAVSRVIEDGHSESASTNYYPLTQGGGANFKKPNERVTDPGAAWTIFRHLCDNVMGDGMQARANCAPDDAFGPDPMQVFWGVKPPLLNLEQTGQSPHFACRPVIGRSRTADGEIQGPGLWTAVRQFYDLVVFQIFGKPERFPQGCPYAQLIVANDFLDAEFRNNRRASAALDKALRPARPGGPPKIVFYGASFLLNDDTTETYTHGRVPGVYLHAMALDNLMTMGRQYIRFEGSWFAINAMMIAISLVGVLASLVLTAGWGALFRITGWDTRTDGTVVILSARTFALVAVLVLNALIIASVILLISAFIFLQFRWAPINWVGIFSVVAFVRIADFVFIRLVWKSPGRRRENEV
tara:strand:+ start:143700 stop:145871 length:2172 start_codon:yes stop_codon:yes gene_type:complete